MKLLRDFPRLCVAGLRSVSGHGGAASRGFNVTVPAPLAKPVGESAVVTDRQRAASARATTARREPASFLKAPRHRRPGR